MRTRRWLVGLVALTAACLFAAEPENLLPQPGMEAVKDGVPVAWSTPEYWGGALAVAEAPDAHGGRHAAKLTTSESRGKVWGRVMTGPVKVSSRLHYRWSVWAKGSGPLKLGAIHYKPKVDENPYYFYTWVEQPVTLTDEWQQISFEVVPTEPAINQIAPIAEIEGADAVAFLDDAAFEVSRRVEGEVSVAPAYSVVAPGGTATVTVTARATDGAAPGGGASIATTAGEAVSESRLTLGEGGSAPFTFTAGEPGLVTVEAVQPDMGEAATAYVDVVSPALAAPLQAAAEAARIPDGSHLLVIGDSLSDFHRGYNWADQLEYWLNRGGHEVTLRNAGVGGDYITRVWDRIEGKPGTHRLNMYENLLEPKPTHVLIFLGHNDSKLTAGSNHTEPVVGVDEYRERVAALVEHLKERTGAQAIILSPTSSVFEICDERAKALLAQGRAATLFGKPEVMEAFTEAARAAAEATGARFVDVYTPTRDHADKRSLFMADGVHINLEGNRLVARTVLEALGR